MPEATDKRQPLNGIRVLDVATILAGPLAAMILGDFGAEVIKVEHPRGDPMRSHGYSKDGHGLWWKVLSRNKRCVTLNLSAAEGQGIFRQLAARSDVIIENFRPGVMERWGLGYESLAALNPGLVMLRVTGFGQYGPYSRRPGFGTLAEAMSGFAYITGQPGGPPTLPPFGLADSIAGLAGVNAVSFALLNRERTDGRGQWIDLSIIEPMLTILGNQPTIFDQLGIIQERQGNRSHNNAPRNTYRTADGRWVAISTSADTVAQRVLTLVGRPDICAEPWFATGEGRARHADVLDPIVAEWIAARPFEQVMAEFDRAGAAVAPVYNIRDVMNDPQYLALNSIASVADEDFGEIKMQNLLFRMSDTPGSIRHTGRGLGADSCDVYAELGMTESDLGRLRDSGVI